MRASFHYGVSTCTSWPENGGKQAWLQPCHPLPAAHLLPRSTPPQATSAARHALVPAVAANPRSSPPSPSLLLPSQLSEEHSGKPNWEDGGAARSQPSRSSSSRTTVHKALVEPLTHSVHVDSSVNTGSSACNGSSSGEDSAIRLSSRINGAQRTSRKSSRPGRPSPERQQQQQGQQQQPAPQSQTPDSLRARHLCAIKCADNVLELLRACLRIEAAYQEGQQPRHSGAGEPIAAGIQEQHRLRQQNGLPNTRPTSTKPARSGQPPPSVIAAAASQMAELLRGGPDVRNLRHAALSSVRNPWGAALSSARNPRDAALASAGNPWDAARSSASHQRPLPGLDAPYEWQGGQWVQQGPGSAAALQAGAVLQHRQAVRQLCGILCRWVEGCVDSGHGSGLQRGFAASRLLLCLARGVQVAGPSCVSGRTPALLAALLLHSPGSWPPTAPLPASTASVHAQGAPRPSSALAQREAAAVSGMQPQQQQQQQWQQQQQHQQQQQELEPRSCHEQVQQGQQQQQEQQQQQQQQWQQQQQQQQELEPRSCNEHERQGLQSSGRDRLVRTQRPRGSSVLAPHHVASLTWAAAVIGPRHFLQPQPKVGLQGRHGIHASLGSGKLSGSKRSCSSSSSSNSSNSGRGKHSSSSSGKLSSSSSSSSGKLSSSSSSGKLSSSSRSSRRIGGSARRQPQSLLRAILGWLYGQSEPLLAGLSTAQLVQLLWGLAKLRKPLPKSRPGIAPRESALPSRVRAFLLVSKTRGAAAGGGGPSAYRTRSNSTHSRLGRRSKSDRPPPKGGRIPLPSPPPSWWKALDAAVLPNYQPQWQRPSQQAPFPPPPSQQQSHSVPLALPPPPMPSVQPLQPSPPGTSSLGYNGSWVPAPGGSSKKSSSSSFGPGLSIPRPASPPWQSRQVYPASLQRHSHQGPPASPPPPLLTRMSAAELALLIWSLGSLHRPQTPVQPRSSRLPTSSPQQLHPSLLCSGQRVQPHQQQLQQQQQVLQRQQQEHQHQQQQQQQQEHDHHWQQQQQQQLEQQHHHHDPHNHHHLAYVQQKPQLQQQQQQQALLSHTEAPSRNPTFPSSQLLRPPPKPPAPASEPDFLEPHDGAPSSLSLHAPAPGTSRDPGTELYPAHSLPVHHSGMPQGSTPPANQQQHAGQHSAQQLFFSPGPQQAPLPPFDNSGMPQGSTPPANQQQHAGHSSQQSLFSLRPHRAPPLSFDNSGMPQGSTPPANQQQHARHSGQQLLSHSPASKSLQSAAGAARTQAQHSPQQMQRAQHAQGPSERLLHLATACCCRIQEKALSTSNSSSSSSSSGGGSGSAWRATTPDDYAVVGFSPEQGAMLLKGLAALRYRPPPALLFSLMMGGHVYPTAASSVAAPLAGSTAGVPKDLSQSRLGRVSANAYRVVQEPLAGPLYGAGMPQRNGVLQREKEDRKLTSTSNRDGSSSSSCSSSGRNTTVPANGSVVGVRVHRNRRPGVPQQLQMLKSAQTLLAQPPPAVLQLLEQDFKERLSKCSAAQLVSQVHGLQGLGLHVPSRELLIGWLEEVHTKRGRLTPMQAVEVLQLLARWGVFPGLPWLSDFLDTAAAKLPTYSRSRIVDLLEGLVALNVGLDTSVQPTRQVPKRRGGKHGTQNDCHFSSGLAEVGGREESRSHKQGIQVAWSQHTELGQDGSRISGSSSGDESADPSHFTNVLPRRAKWVRSVLHTFKSRRQPTARVDQLDRLQAALRRLCTPGLYSAVEATLKDVVNATAPPGYS